MPAIVCAGALFAFFVIFGMRQMREGGGTLTRLLLVSAGLAVLAAAPILLWETSSGAPANLMLAVPALVASMPLLRPLRRPGSSVALPLIDDPPLLARVESVARRLGVAMPRVRLIGTVGEMQALAGVGGIQAPSLLLADGILHRLSPAEQDGIIAHELAHIRNGSLWALPAAAAVATTLAIVLMDSNVAAWLVSFAAFSLFPAVYAVANRYIELDCDLRAARAVGFVEMATALDKIHAVHLLGGRGWLTHLFYAVATHPAGPVRYEWLRARSAGALPPRPQDEPARRLHRICSSVAFAALVAALTAGRLFQGRAPTVAFALLMAPLACVLLLCVLLMRRIQAANKERFRQRPPGKRLALAGAGSLGLGFALGLGAKPLAVALLTAGASRAGIWVWNVMPLVAVAALLCGTAVLFWGALRFNRWQKLQLAMTAALARHDYRNAIGLLRARPGMLKRDPSLRYALAVALFLAGEREAALADLVRLVEERLPAALLLLAHLARGSDPARALAFSREAVAQLPRDPLARLSLVRSLRHAGLAGEAARELERAAGLPDAARSAELHATRALLAADRGDTAGARQLIAAALKKSPGDASVLASRAEVEVLGGDVPAARTAIAAARDAARANPFALLEDHLDALERDLAVRDTAA